MKTVAISSAFLVLVGCATPTTGVLHDGDGNYIVMRQGGSALTSTSELTLLASKEASAYCDSRGMKFRKIFAKEVQARPLGGWPESTILFRCE